MEYGIFSDEGQIERGMFTLVEAETRLLAVYAGDGCWAAECCPTHPENEESNCEECADEDCDKDGCDDEDEDDGS